MKNRQSVEFVFSAGDEQSTVMEAIKTVTGLMGGEPSPGEVHAVAPAALTLLHVCTGYIEERFGKEISPETVRSAYEIGRQIAAATAGQGRT